MLANLTAQLALKKVGLSSDSLDFSYLSGPSDQSRRREPNRQRKRAPQGYEDDYDDGGGGGWSSWVPSLSVKSLPLTVHPWLNPKPPPVAVGRVPSVGSPAPADRDGKLRFGRQRTLVVFLRCAGCAFAQKTFLALRSIANRHVGTIRCIAVSHSSAHATKKWIDFMGGAWDVEVVIDEDRAVYAAWGLGLGNIMYLFHPAAQVQGWKEKGWLGDEVAAAVNRTGGVTMRERGAYSRAGNNDDDDDDEDDYSGIMGNKWQEAGAFAVDGKGTVVWGGKATRSDDMMNLEEGARILQL